MNIEAAQKMVAEARKLADEIREQKLVPGSYQLFNSDEHGAYFKPGAEGFGPVCSLGHLYARCDDKLESNIRNGYGEGAWRAIVDAAKPGVQCLTANEAISRILNANDNIMENDPMRPVVLSERLREFADALEALIESER